MNRIGGGGGGSFGVHRLSGVWALCQAYKTVKIYIPLNLELPPLGSYLNKIIQMSTKIHQQGCSLPKNNNKNHRKTGNDLTVSK